MSRHARSAHVADGRGLSRGVSEVSQSPSCSSVIKPLFRASLMAASVAAAIGVATPAMAFEFSLADGEVKGSFDTTLSYGILMRADKRDPTLVGRANGGTSASQNSDDGNRTYDRGDVTSSLFKMNNELELGYKNFGFFARTLAFYDTAIDGKSTSIGGTTPGLTPEAQKRLRDDARILDFYLRGSFDVAGKNLNARLGRQVINWGESAFIPNGINVINPVDIARLRAPGSEVKEGLLPQEMAWVSQEITNNVSVEAFYQFKWRETRIDPRGSFFSTTDVLSPGSSTLFGVTGMPLNDVGTPRDSGQYGLATRILAPSLGNTEFGLYAMNYHSRTPFLGVIKGRNFTFSGMTPTGGDFGRYFIEYPEDISLFGASVSGSTASGVSLQAEYSYRPKQPIQISAIELIVASVPDNANTVNPGIPAGVNRANNAGVDSANTPGGSRISGVRRVDMHQIQAAATQNFGRLMGASQLVGVGELGLTYLDLPDGILFEGPGASVPFSPSLNPQRINSNGYATKRSWGYRGVLRADYPNAIGAATLTPRVAFAHDVRGVGPTFNQGTQSFSVGVTYNLRQVWQADLSYTAFMGGRTYSGVSPLNGGAVSTSANALKDRDFIAATVSYSF